MQALAGFRGQRPDLDFAVAGFELVYFEQTHFPPLRYDGHLGLRPPEEVKCSRLVNAEHVPNKN